MKKAYRTRAIGIESIVAAETGGEARLRTARQAMDAGFRIRFTEVTATRAPEHDAWAAVDATGIGWAEELLPRAPGGTP